MANHDEVIESIKLLSYQEKLSLIEEIVHSLREELANENSVQKTPEELGWPPGFFEQTFGSLRDDPIVRQPQPEMPVREALNLDAEMDK